MSKLIIKDTLAQLRKGYPTVSDKYNVEGGIVAEGGVKVGELVRYTNTPGYYKAFAGATAIDELAGVVLGVNVKLNPIWPNDGANALEYKTGEAFDLFKDGFIAMELDETVPTVTRDAVAAIGELTEDTDIIPGKNYYTRASNNDGIGYLNTGTHKYTLVDTPVQGSLTTYYELTVLGENASTNLVTPNKKVAVILATGKLTTIEAVTTGVVEWPGAKFTGFVDGRLAELRVRE